MARETWTFLTNHAHVLACLRRDSNMAVREVASLVGITERAVLQIIGDLEAADVVSRRRVGRRNRYAISLEAAMRHPLLYGARVGDLVDLLDTGAGQDRLEPAEDSAEVEDHRTSPG